MASLGVTVVSLTTVLFGKALIACRLRRAPEGWRRTVGVLLRSESTRFALSAFGVRVPGGGGAGTAIDTQIARALVSHLATEPDAHFALTWDRWVTLRRRTEWVDVVLLRFSAAGDLVAVEPHLSAARTESIDSAMRENVHRRLVAAYNSTTHLPEERRPFALLNAVIATARPEMAAAHAYLHRLLAACSVSVEAIDRSVPEQRFAPPQFCERRSLGFGYLSIVARPDPSGRTTDLWFSAHHVGLDGVPLQELVSRLERAWGHAEAVVFPNAGTGAPFVDPRACSAPGERQVDHLITFADFAPVRALRKDLNARFGASIGGEVTFGALLAWLLTREPEFAGVRVASTVDVAASGGYDRDVDVVPLRPADFASGDSNDPWGGFVEYVREFNRLIAASRTRTSPLRAGMQTAGLLPAWAHAQAVRADPGALDSTFGTLCITIVRDAKVFVAPMTDFGLRHGFFAIGSADLVTADGRRVASVSIKGDAGEVAHYPSILQRVIDRCASTES